MSAELFAHLINVITDLVNCLEYRIEMGPDADDQEIQVLGNANEVLAEASGPPN